MLPVIELTEFFKSKHNKHTKVLALQGVVGSVLTSACTSISHTLLKYNLPLEIHKLTPAPNSHFVPLYFFNSFSLHCVIIPQLLYLFTCKWVVDQCLSDKNCHEQSFVQFLNTLFILKVKLLSHSIGICLHLTEEPVSEVI